MRVLYLLVFLLGIAAIFYPSLSPDAERAIGKWAIAEQADAYLPLDLSVKAEDAPFVVEIEMTAVGWQPGQGAALTVVADSNGRTLLAKPLTFSTTKPREINPQTQEKIYSDNAGTISATKDTSYRFTITPGDAEGVATTIRSVHLILRSVSMVDPRIRPGGFILAAIGFIGFVLAMARGRKTPSNPNSQPPTGRWGRGAG
ncbi:hypothetical protein GA830_11685 [Mesorhizobium sp. NBSH29]|uniref:hypothetical protein n=1 Tax=Mesorhizobium sp. NBSH29 TaxID=2654249 RepID=UPI00189660A6|nr:hypothetical protein [Mesorhizobium sp. NBSH29]QPC87329.1 hypothetical protein GA830_11685 [Mesorhizobium sp. NBSH29]